MSFVILFLSQLLAFFVCGTSLVANTRSPLRLLCGVVAMAVQLIWVLDASHSDQLQHSATVLTVAVIVLLISISYESYGREKK